MESNNFKHFVELKKTFGSADQVKPHTVFNIFGNKLITVVGYALQSVLDIVGSSTRGAQLLYFKGIVTKTRG